MKYLQCKPNIIDNRVDSIKLTHFHRMWMNCRLEPSREKWLVLKKANENILDRIYKVNRFS